MSCLEFEPLITRDVDGVITAEDLARLEQHVASCEACLRERAAHRKISRSLRASGSVDIRPGLSEAIVAGVRARTRLAPRFGFARQAAAVLLFAGIGTLCGWMIGRVNQEPRDLIAGPAQQVKTDADYRHFLTEDLGLTEDRANRVLSLRKEYEGYRDAARQKIRPEISKLDAEEKAEIWRVLPDEARVRFLKHDPGFAPPASAPASGPGK